MKDNQGQNTLEIEFVEKSYTHYKACEKIQEFKTSNESKLRSLEIGVINTVLENTFGKTQQNQQKLNEFRTPINQSDKSNTTRFDNKLRSKKSLSYSPSR